MKILHVIANLAPRYGGPSKACFEMARALSRLGHMVSIYTTNQDGPVELDVPIDRSTFRNGVEIRYFPIQCPRFWGFSIPFAQALSKMVKNFDIVHIHSFYMFHNIVAAYYCRKHNVPYLIRPHGTLDPFIHKRHRLRKGIMELLFERKNIKHAAAIHFTTESEKMFAKSYTFKTSGIVVPLGLELSEYENLPDKGIFKRRYPEFDGKKIILFLGRLNFKKGLDILVRAFAKVARKRTDVHLVIAGPDNEDFGSRVKAWLNEEDILDRTLFTGMLLGKDKLAAFRDADMFVLPSYTENFGISVIEAMACKVPVVISEKVNIWKDVKNYGAGEVGLCDSDSFAEMMLKLIDDSERPKMMGEKGKALVKDRFQWKMIGYELEKVYKKILNLKNE